MLPLLLALTAHATPDRPALELALDDYSLETRDYCFASGLHISFQEDHSQPVVSVTSVIDRGSSNDPVGKEGIAHLIEHLWFRSRRDDLPPVWDLLTEMGATINAFTARDVTTFMTVAPRSMLPAVLHLEAARLMGAVDGVTADVVVTEREVVRNELRQGEAFDLGLDNLYGRMYPPGHPYARSTIGSHDSLDQVSLTDVQDFVAANYTPANTTVMVVGDFSLDETPDLLTQAFPMSLVVDPEHPDAPVSAQACPVRIQGPSPEPPDPTDHEIQHIKAPIERTTAVLAWALPGGWRPEQGLYEVVANTMTWAISTYINPPGLPPGADRNEASCFLDPAKIASTAICAIEMKDGANPDKVIGKAVDGLYQMWDPDHRRWQSEWYGYSRLASMARVFRSAENVASLFEGRATDTALFTHFTGDSRYYSRNFEWLSQVNGTDAAKVAERYLNRKRYVAVVLDPMADTGEGGDDGESRYKGRPREPATQTVADLDALTPQVIAHLTVVPDLSPMRDFTLDNGLRVVLYPYGSVPLTRVALLVHGGARTEPIPGLDRYTDDHTTSTPPELDVDLDEASLRVGGEWDNWSDGLVHVLGLSGSSANLDAQLYLLRRRLDTLKFQAPSGRAYTQSIEHELLHRWESPDPWARKLTQAALFPGHPLGHGFDEHAVEAIRDMDETAPVAWNRSLYRPDNATLFIVGRVDADKAEALARDWFSSWAPYPGAGPVPQALPPAPAPPERQVIVLDHPSMRQTQVTLACQAGPATQDTEETREMLAAVLDEMAWTALRETAGVTYGAGAHAQEFPGGATTLQMYSLVQNDAAALATQTFFDLIDRASRGDLDPKVLKIMQLGAARGYVLHQQSSQQMLRRLMSPVRQGEGWERLSGHGQRLSTVTVEAMAPLVQSCAGHEVVTLVGPKEGITAQLDEAKIPYTVFDWQAERDQRWAEMDPKGWKLEQKRRAKDGR